MKTLIPQNGNKLNIINKDLANKVIISGNIIENNNLNTQSISTLLLTKHNLYNNINFCFKNNNFENPRLLFLKYNSINDICRNFIFTQKNSNIIINNTSLPFNLYKTLNYGEFDIDNTIINNDLINNKKLTFLQYYINIYKPYNYSNYYNIKLSDFINLYDLSGSININDTISYEFLSYLINKKSLENNFSNNELINYDATYFNKILYKNIDNDDFNDVDLSLNNIIDFSNDNLFLYNKLNNTTTLNITYKYNLNDITDISGDHNLYKDISINFFVLKNLDNTNNYGKIYLNKNFNYFNCFVIDNCSNLYNNSSELNNLYENSGIIFLSLGNGITGLTQKNLKNIKFDFDINETKNRLGSTISKSYNNINKVSFYSSLENTEELPHENYFVDNSYNFDYTNITYIYIKDKDRKLFNLDISNLNYFIDNDFSSNLYYSKYINYSIRNNIDIQNLLLTNISNEIEDSYKYGINNINYNSINYKFIITDTLDENYFNKSIINTPVLDFRYNYSKKFDTSFFLNLTYDNSYILTVKNVITTNIANFFKLVVNNYVETTAAEDFTNVNCIFIYNNPEKTTNPDFLYPNNNIEIITDSTIDTFEKAIVNLPELQTSTTNYTFIPSKNGSNLSRKHIQGLIGLNNVPRLLSIEPYDPSFIDGRGFLTQYQINDTCLTDEDRVKNKINIFEKNEKKINNDYIKKKQFANIVKSRGRNKLSKNKPITELSCNTIIQYPSAKNYYTPFKLFKTGRGNYTAPN